jgi:hypothetical protein
MNSAFPLFAWIRHEAPSHRRRAAETSFARSVSRTRVSLSLTHPLYMWRFACPLPYTCMHDSPSMTDRRPELDATTPIVAAAPGAPITRTVESGSSGANAISDLSQSVSYRQGVESTRCHLVAAGHIPRSATLGSTMSLGFALTTSARSLVHRLHRARQQIFPMHFFTRTEPFSIPKSGV